MGQGTDKKTTKQPDLDPITFYNRWQTLLKQGQEAWLDKAKEIASTPKDTKDPFGLVELTQNFWHHLANNPKSVIDAQTSFSEDFTKLLQESCKKINSDSAISSQTEKESDKRFKDELWQNHPVFDFIKKSYLLFSKHTLEITNNLDNIDDKTAKRIDFFTKQFVDALAPSNFFFTNPTVLKETMDRKGENLIEGYKNFVQDLSKKDNIFTLSTVDKTAFEVGKNLATTKGSVIYKNDLIELIHYANTSKDVYKTPLLITPPWINKFYILDMQEQNSFIKWTLDQGHDVYCISWVNPDKKLAEKSFENYLEEGLLTAIEQVKKQSGEKQVNCIGYCLGGTLLSCALSYLKTKKRNDIKSATFLTTMIDFSGAGDMLVFIDEQQIETLEEKIKEIGYLPGEDLKQVFSLMRANDLIWSFFINNYLMGRSPLPFDLLYWNDDSTRMPYMMHIFYLKEMYLKNNLIKQNGITLLDTPINISDIDTPSYFVSAREDHIAPWKTTYEGPKQFKGDKQFVLTEAGHIAGIINPPNKNKYGYWTQDKWPEQSESWLNEAQFKKESWWIHWNEWIKKHAGKKIIRNNEKARLTPLYPAPGMYVLEKS